MTITCNIEQHEPSGAHRDWNVDLDAVSVEAVLDAHANDWSMTLRIPSQTQEIFISLSSGLSAVLLADGESFYDCVGDPDDRGRVTFVHGGQPAEHPRRHCLQLSEAKSQAVKFISMGHITVPDARWELQGSREDE